MKLKDWDEEEQRRGKNKGTGPDGKPGAGAVSDEVWEEDGSFPDEEYEGSESEADLEAEEWEEFPTEMDEESRWDGTMPEEDSEDGRRDDRGMPEQDLEEDERWEESELDSKPGVSYRWKKFNLDSEPDADGWREEPGSNGYSERHGMPERQNSEGAHKGHGGTGATGTSRKGQKTAKKEEEEGWEEELPPLKPRTKVLIFIGLAVAAAIICAVLWRFAHPERPDDSEGQDIPSQATESLDDASEEAPKLDLDAPGEGQSGESLSGLTPEGADPDGGTLDGTGTEPEAAGSEPGDGTGAAGESPSSEPEEPVAGTESMAFQDVQESVTPKDVVNLRKVPNTADADNIVAQARNGETLARVGFNPDTGWSKIDYNGQTLYAVSQYLTTDLGYRPAVQPADPNRVSTISGRIIIFESCDDWISPKEYVNLRTEPSTTEGDATVSCQLNYGEKVHRTGYSTDSGWSRVEYNGQVLYVVTSLMYVVPAE